METPYDMFKENYVHYSMSIEPVPEGHVFPDEEYLRAQDPMDLDEFGKAWLWLCDTGINFSISQTSFGPWGELPFYAMRRILISIPSKKLRYWAYCGIIQDEESLDIYPEGGLDALKKMLQQTE